MKRSIDAIAVNYDVSPQNACGAVWSTLEQRFVPVVPGEEFHDDEVGHSLWEYSDTEGNVRACLLKLAPGKSSPVWKIEDNAGNGQYRESELTVSGSGRLERLREHLFGSVVRSEVALPQAPSEHSARVLPGDVFAARAGDDGLVMLSVFPEKPFLLEYERRI